MTPLRPPFRRLSLCIALTAFAAVPFTAFAAEPKYEFHQPSMEMQKGLNRLAATLHTPILFDGTLVEGHRSPALNGMFSRNEALQLALVDTGLLYRMTESGVILVYRPTAAASVAQTSNDQSIVRSSTAEEPPAIVVVTGIRKSILSSSAQSQASPNILAVVVATDIGKLPDGNAAEAMQRISGIQITRDQGEGAGIAIRGLSQVNSQIDGRSIFTASSGRLLSFEDVPSELLSGISVYKTPSANQIEGGLSGVVDLQLRKPFDFKGRRIAGQINSTYYDHAAVSRPQASLLYSDRWLTHMGEMGLLISASYQTSAFKSDYDAGGSPTTRTDLFDLNHNGSTGDVADAVVTPQGGGVAEQSGTRLRQGADAHFQWRPSAATEIYVDAFSYKFKTNTQATLLFAEGTTPLPYPASGVTLVPGTNVFQSGTWHDLFLDSDSYNGGRVSDVSQLSFGGKWEQGNLRISGDTSYNLGHSFITFYQLALSSSLTNATTGKSYGAVPAVYQDYSTDLPVFRVSGIDLTDPENMVFDRAIQSLDWVHGGELAGRIDGEYRMDQGGVKSIAIGVRYSDRFTTESGVYQYNDLGGVPVSTHEDIVSLAHLELFNRGTGAPNIQYSFLTASPAAVQDFQSIRADFNIPAPSPTDAAASRYRIRERVAAAYAMVKIDAHPGELPLTGNIGFRLVETQVDTMGSAIDASGSLLPINLQTDYSNILPQMNLKADITPTTAIRFSAYDTLTRQDFGILAPRVSLDFLFHIGAAGNPKLRPLSATNFDVGIDHHDSRNNSTYLNLFFKRVSGFIQNEVHQESYFGQTFEITRPGNGGSGKVWGAELGTTRFLTNLPRPFDGLGFQANYTYVDQAAPSPISTASLPLEGLSKHSFNLIGFYEHGPVSGRIAYNYRSPYVITSVTNGISGFASDWSRAQAVLDASISFEVTPNLKIAVDLANLGNLRSLSYYTDIRMKHNAMETDRRFTIGLQLYY